MRLIGAGAFGSVWLEQEDKSGQLRAVKRLQRFSLGPTGFGQELLALITLADASTLEIPLYCPAWLIVDLAQIPIPRVLWLV